MTEIVFARSRPLTLGVELEFQILDQRSLNLTARAPRLLARVPEPLRDRVAPEFMQSILEIRTGVCDTVEEVARDLRRTIVVMEEVAAAEDCLFYGASLHPFAEPARQRLSDSRRYRRIMEELQYVGRQFISQGLHIHVGVDDPDLAIHCCDVLQAYLPVFLGLSCSSPYFRGEDTGLCSYRTKLFEALPLAGISGYLGGWRAYLDEIRLLRENQVIREVKDLWWDVRPSPDLGTVEIRTCDLPARFVEVLGLTSLIRALVAAIMDGLARPARISPQLLRCNKWQAARHGLDGRFSDPLGLLPTGIQPLRRAAREMIELLAPYLRRWGDTGVESLEMILERGTSADRQRRLMSEQNDFLTMIRRMRDVYWNP